MYGCDGGRGCYGLHVGLSRWMGCLVTWSTVEKAQAFCGGGVEKIWESRIGKLNAPFRVGKVGKRNERPSFYNFYFLL